MNTLIMTFFLHQAINVVPAIILQAQHEDIVAPITATVVTEEEQEDSVMMNDNTDQEDISNSLYT